VSYRLAVALELTSETDHAGSDHRDRHTHLTPAVPVTIAESCGAALRTELAQVAQATACGFHRLAVAIPQVARGRACPEQPAGGTPPSGCGPSSMRVRETSAPDGLSSGTDLAGESIVTQRVLVVRRGRCRHHTGSLGRGRLHSTLHGLASNVSLYLSGGLRMLASLALT
jgi:hypothetical protein